MFCLNFLNIDSSGEAALCSKNWVKWANLFKQLLLGDRETCELDTDSVMMEPKNMKPNVSFDRSKF